MTDKRFRLDTGSIIDSERGVLSDAQVRNTLNKLNDENEQLKQNIGIILEYCRVKGKYAMDRKEMKAHNVLQRIVNELER